MHLKRFNCVNNKWVKSQKAVHFPFENFDPTPYLAAIPQETILRHRELREAKSLSLPENVTTAMTLNRRVLNRIDDQIKTIGDDNENIIDYINSQKQHQSDHQHITNNSLDSAIYTNTPKEMSLQQQTQLLYDEINCNNNSNTPVTDHKDNYCDKTKYRQRLISTSLDKSPIIDNEFQDFHEHKLMSNEDKFDPKYKLYAVVVSNLFVFLKYILIQYIQLCVEF